MTCLVMYLYIDSFDVFHLLIFYMVLYESIIFVSLLLYLFFFFFFCMNHVIKFERQLRHIIHISIISIHDTFFFLHSISFQHYFCMVFLLLLLFCTPLFRYFDYGSSFFILVDRIFRFCLASLMCSNRGA